MSRSVILPEGFVIIYLSNSLESHHRNSNVSESECEYINVITPECGTFLCKHMHSCVK